MQKNLLKSYTVGTSATIPPALYEHFSAGAEMRTYKSMVMYETKMHMKIGDVVDCGCIYAPMEKWKMRRISAALWRWDYSERALDQQEDEE